MVVLALQRKILVLTLEKPKTKVCLSFRYNGDSSCLLVNEEKMPLKSIIKM